MHRNAILRLVFLQYISYIISSGKCHKNTLKTIFIRMGINIISFCFGCWNPSLIFRAKFLKWKLNVVSLFCCCLLHRYNLQVKSVQLFLEIIFLSFHQELFWFFFLLINNICNLQLFNISLEVLLLLLFYVALNLICISSWSLEFVVSLLPRSN